MKVILVDWAGYALCHHPKTRTRIFHRSHGLRSVLLGINSSQLNTSFDVVLVINEAALNGEYDYLLTEFPFISTILYRQSNLGFDIGAYDYGYQYLKKQCYDGPIVFMNSVCVIQNKSWLDDYLESFYLDDSTGLYGMTFNQYATHFYYSKKIFRPHIQSYFLLSSMAVLGDVFENHLPGYTSRSKKRVITHGEIGLSKKVLQAGYSIRAKQQSFCYRLGDQPTRLFVEDLMEYILSRFEV